MSLSTLVGRARCFTGHHWEVVPVSDPFDRNATIARCVSCDAELEVRHAHNDPSLERTALLREALNMGDN